MNPAAFWGALILGAGGLTTLAGATGVIAPYRPVLVYELPATIDAAVTKTKLELAQLVTDQSKIITQLEAEIRSLSREALAERIRTLNASSRASRFQQLQLQSDASPTANLFRLELDIAIRTDDQQLQVLQCRLDRMNGIDRVC